ncbi:MAG: c-type cytochrome [Lysobacterales bacterium]|jgi:cytochrome c553
MKYLAYIFLLIVALSGCSKEPESTEPAIDLEAGRQIAQRECSGCHGADGAGKTADIPNLGGQPEDYLIDAMHAYRDGRRHHAALQDMIAGFKEADIRNIAAWFASLPPVPVQPAKLSGEIAYREGAESARVCTGCHGERGISDTPGVPSLAGQQPAYLIAATQEYADGTREHAGKADMMKGLRQVDIEKMAMYFSAQAPELRQPPPFGDPEEGEALSATCGECHGSRGISHDPLVPNLAGQEPTYLVNTIKAYRDHKRGHENMVGDKTDAQIEDIAAYYSIQAAGSLTDTGEELETVVAKCNRCHGRAEGETNLVVPKLNGQKRDYLLRVMKEYRDNDRGNSMMHKMSSGYSDELLEQLADWYATHPKQE